MPKKKAKKKYTKKLKINILGEPTQASIKKKLPYRLLCSYDKLIHIDELHLNPDNPNEHPELQITLLAQVMKTNGVRRPIRVSTRTGLVTAGHGQILSSRVNGWDYLPVDFQDYKNEADEFNDVVADNSIAQMSKLDYSVINRVIVDLGPDFNVADMGLPDFKIEPADNDSNSESNTEDDLPDKVVKRCKKGDFWVLGDHFLLCGDATKDWDKLLNGAKPELCFTSPPYLNQRDYSGQIELDPKYLAKFLMAPCELYIVNLGIKRSQNEIIQYWDEYINVAKKIGHKFLSWNVWNRHGFGYTIGQATAMFTIDHEWILVFGKERKTLNKTIENKQKGISKKSTIRQKDGSTEATFGTVKSLRQLGTVYTGDIARYTGESHQVHPAMFPVELPEVYISACSQKNDIVYDPFGGSGSTLIACEKTNRKCFMMEIDSTYCDVILSRWEKFTNKKAQKVKAPKKKS